jgi:hypothetical protein
MNIQTVFIFSNVLWRSGVVRFSILRMLLTVSLLAVTLLLAACGGGGNGGPAYDENGNFIWPPNVTLTASQGTFPNTITLSWTVSGDVNSCTASGDDSSWYNGIFFFSATIYAPSTNTTYTLTCTGTGGTGSASVRITGTGLPPPVALTLDKATITAGDSATLSWRADVNHCSPSSNPLRINLWYNPLATSGSGSTGAVTSTTIYTLSCVLWPSQVSFAASATLTVIPTNVNSANITLNEQ